MIFNMYLKSIWGGIVGIWMCKYAHLKYKENLKALKVHKENLKALKVHKENLKIHGASRCAKKTLRFSWCIKVHKENLKVFMMHQGAQRKPQGFHGTSRCPEKTSRFLWCIKENHGFHGKVHKVCKENIKVSMVH